MVGDLLDPGGDLGVGRRHDLGPVAEVDLVAVVLRRVVRRRHHDTGHAAEVPDAERDHRRGGRHRHQQGPEAGAREDLGGVAGEHVGLVPGVVPDDHRATGQALVQQVRGQTGRGLTDDDPVHPVRAGPDRSAQPSGAELQAAAEGVGRARRGTRSIRPRSGPADWPARRGCPDRDPGRTRRRRRRPAPGSSLPARTARRGRSQARRQARRAALRSFGAACCPASITSA